MYLESMAAHFVICARCSQRFSVPYEIGLWSCPICRADNESAATLADKVVTAPTARLRRKPAPMQLAELLGRLTRKRSLYGYADKLIDVACPKCQTGITMTNNVRTARCANCQAVVQRT
jgi:ribosomal protein L37AE/L43A